MILRAREGGETTVSQTASKHLECLLKIPGSGSSSKATKIGASGGRAWKSAFLSTSVVYCH